MIREIRLYFRLKPFLKRLAQETKMKFSVNMSIQVLMTIAAALLAIMDLMPPKQAALIVAGVGVIKSITGLLAHFSNPDGTPAEAAYQPEKSSAAASGGIK